MLRRAPAILLTLVGSLSAAGSRADSPVDFTRDVRPILARSCFKCHGPDPKARKAKLRLDDRADAVRDRGGYAAVVPGDPEQSELVTRIEDDDDTLRMPPPEMKQALTPAEKETL